MTAPVPVIDIAAYRAGAPGQGRELARRIDQACREIGFLVIAGHGVPPGLVARADAAARAFFDLPEPAKLGYRQRPGGAYRGYFPLQSNAIGQSLADAAPPDLFERFAIGNVDADLADPYFAATDIARGAFGPNIWPAELPDFAAVMTEYYRAMSQLAATLMRLFALALDLDEDFFATAIDRHMTSLVIQNYPEQPTPPLPGQLRTGPHSDYGSLTILKTEDKPGGLEVMDPSGTWRPVSPIPGAFIVNIGDLMAQWTNDRWVSTLHRVVNPPRDQALGSRRQSLIFFHQPNYDAVVECLPSCRGAAPPKYQPTTSGAHLMAKLTRQIL